MKTKTEAQHRGVLYKVAAAVPASMLTIFFASVGIMAQAASFESPLGDITLYDFLLNVLNAVIFILFPIIILMIVITGFLFVVAQGNPTKIQTARRALLWTVVGGLIILGSKALALAIEATIDNIQN